ncbi:hypothetical protein I3A70_14135 [Salmonella enterica]|nr:hypothetical protein [Salmonella enterica]
MKKTLIALAVVASAAVSGSAMAAWTTSGTGGTFTMSGELTPKDRVTPWEVKVGAAVKFLDANIEKGQNSVDIPVKQAIPLLGIRTSAKSAFSGAYGISPQINFGNAINLDQFKESHTPLTLEVKDENDAKIGQLTVSMGASALISWTGGWNGSNYVYSPEGAGGFFGGLPKTESAVMINDVAALIMPEIADNFDNQNQSVASRAALAGNFWNRQTKYSAYYGAGIESNAVIKITLDSPVVGDEVITWKASLPIVVSYAF